MAKEKNTENFYFDNSEFVLELKPVVEVEDYPSIRYNLGVLRSGLSDIDHFVIMIDQHSYIQAMLQSQPSEEQHENGIQLILKEYGKTSDSYLSSDINEILEWIDNVPIFSIDCESELKFIVQEIDTELLRIERNRKVSEKEISKLRKVLQILKNV